MSSKLIDKLNQLSRPEPQPMGFRTKQSTSPKSRIQLIACLAQEGAENLTGYMAGADAVLIRISQISSGIKTIESVSQAVSNIPWGGWLQGNSQEKIEPMMKAGYDFVVFPASTPLAMLQNDEVGKILEVEASLTDGLLRTTNELPVDAVLIAGERKEDYSLTWHHLMLFQRFASLLTKSLLVTIPSNVTADELQALWEAGVDGIVVDVNIEQPQDMIKDLRQMIDKLAFPSPRKREKAQSRLPYIGSTGVAAEEEEEEEEE